MEHNGLTTSPLPVFLTGSDRIPIYGMSSLRIVIQSTSSGQDYLPVAHTCYNLLDLPKYSTKEILSTRLTQAIDHYEGFSLAWGSSHCQHRQFCTERKYCLLFIFVRHLDIDTPWKGGKERRIKRLPPSPFNISWGLSFDVFDWPVKGSENFYASWLAF